MSVNAVGGVSQSAPQKDLQRPATPSPDVTPFSQQLDTQTAQAGAAHGHHGHHHAGGGQSVTSSAATAASAAGVTPSSSIGASLLHLLS